MNQAAGDALVVSDAFGDCIEEIATADQLEDEVNILHSFELLHKPDDVRMATETHDRDFVFNHVFLRKNISLDSKNREETKRLYLALHDAFIDDLHGEFGARVGHSALVDDRKVAVSDFLHDFVSTNN